MDYTNFRSFLTTMGLDPDNLENKTLSKFKPTANVVSGLTLSNLTLPPDNESGTKQDLDIEGSAVPSSPYFGPFAGVGLGVNFVPPFMQQMNRGVGPQKSQTLSGGID